MKVSLGHAPQSKSETAVPFIFTRWPGPHVDRRLHSSRFVPSCHDVLPHASHSRSEVGVGCTATAEPGSQFVKPPHSRSETAVGAASSNWRPGTHWPVVAHTRSVVAFGTFIWCCTLARHVCQGTQAVSRWFGSGRHSPSEQGTQSRISSRVSGSEKKVPSLHVGC